MSKYVYIQIHGVDKPAKIKADRVVKTDTGQYELYEGQNKVGQFLIATVDGWWIQDEDDGPISF